MKERIKELRKSLGLNQTDFGEKIGVKQTTIAGYENGSRQPIDAVINSICKEYRVNEEWMRYGTGDMFVHLNRQQKIAQFSADLFRSEEESFKSRLIMALAELDEEDWVLLEKVAKKIAKKD